MIKVGIIGFGFMGAMHFRCYKALADAKLVAVCDIDEDKLKDTGGEAGNIAGAEEPLDFAGVELYTDFDKMIAEAGLVQGDMGVSEEVKRCPQWQAAAFQDFHVKNAIREVLLAAFIHGDALQKHVRVKGEGRQDKKEYKEEIFLPD